MKNKESAMKSGAKHKRPISIGNKKFDGIIDASIYYNKATSTIGEWLRRGVSPEGEECKYLDNEKQKKGGLSKPVIVDNIYYSSIADAARAINVAPNNLRLALKNNKHICKGHSCEYANQQPS